jgi:hypothetical protein
MGFNKLTKSAICLSMLLFLPAVSAFTRDLESGVLLATNLGVSQPRQAVDQGVNAVPTSKEADASNAELLPGTAKPVTKNDTVHRYRNSGRILFLGGPEAFSI